MNAWMLPIFVLIITAMSFSMAEPVSVNAVEVESDVSSNARQKRQFLFGYPSYRYSYGFGYAYPSYSRLYLPSYSIWGR